MQCVPKQPLASFESWLLTKLVKKSRSFLYVDMFYKCPQLSLPYLRNWVTFYPLWDGCGPQNVKIKYRLCSYLLRRSDFTPGSLKESVAHHASNMHSSSALHSLCFVVVAVCCCVVALLLSS